MSESQKPAGGRRGPLVFDVSDPALVAGDASGAADAERLDRPVSSVDRPSEQRPPDEVAVQAPLDAGANGSAPGRPFTVLIAALAALGGLAASLAFASFISGVLARGDWIGLAGWSLLAIALVAALVLAAREAIGIVRLNRLAALRREAEAVFRSPDTARELDVVRRLRRNFAHRSDVAWRADRFASYEADVRDPGDLLRLADRELIAPLDGQARRMVLASAKRVSLVTAMSPIALLSVGFVALENLRLLRALATLYGGRPGFFGGLRLARLVFVHILATGGVALTDDLIGQFIGQDLMRRLSRRLGEGLFNGAMTARVGVAALDICRPLPFIESKPVRVRDILAELTSRQQTASR